MLIPCVSGINAANRSHVKQVPYVAAYDNYYDIVVDTCEIGVGQFAYFCYASTAPTGVRDDSERAIVVDVVSS